MWDKTKIPQKSHYFVCWWVSFDRQPSIPFCSVVYIHCWVCFAHDLKIELNIIYPFPLRFRVTAGGCNEFPLKTWQKYQLKSPVSIYTYLTFPSSSITESCLKKNYIKFLFSHFFSVPEKALKDLYKLHKTFRGAKNKYENKF